MPDNYTFLSSAAASAPPVDRQPDTNIVFRFNSNDFVRSHKGWTLTRLWLTAVLARAAYVNDNAIHTRIKDSLGAKEFRIFSTLNPFVPNVVRYSFDSGYVYTVAGTTNIAQWLGFIFGQEQKPVPDTPQGLAFAPFLDTAEAVYGTIEDDLKKQSSKQDFVLIGHSLGGAVAHILGRLLVGRHKWFPTRVVTFGCPRVGNAEYQRVWYPNTIRVVNDLDPVCSVPPPVFVKRLTIRGVPTPVAQPARYKHPQAVRIGIGRGYIDRSGDDDDGSRHILNGMTSAGSPEEIARHHYMGAYVNILGDKFDVPTDSYLTLVDDVNTTLRVTNH